MCYLDLGYSVRQRGGPHTAFLRSAVMLMRCPNSCTPHEIMCCVMVVLPPFLLLRNETFDRVFVLWYDGHAHALALRVNHHNLQCAPQKAVDGTLPAPAILHRLVCHLVAGYDLMATTSSV